MPVSTNTIVVRALTDHLLAVWFVTEVICMLTRRSEVAVQAVRE